MSQQSKTTSSDSQQTTSQEFSSTSNTNPSNQKTTQDSRATTSTPVTSPNEPKDQDSSPAREFPNQERQENKSTADVTSAGNTERTATSIPDDSGPKTESLPSSPRPIDVFNKEYNEPSRPTTSDSQGAHSTANASSGSGNDSGVQQSRPDSTQQSSTVAQTSQSASSNFTHSHTDKPSKHSSDFAPSVPQHSEKQAKTESAPNNQQSNFSTDNKPPYQNEKHQGGSHSDNARPDQRADAKQEYHHRSAPFSPTQAAEPREQNNTNKEASQPSTADASQEDNNFKVNNSNK